MPIDWEAASDLDPSSLQTALLSEVDQVMGAHLGSHEDEDRALAQLPEPLRAIWLMNWLDFEVSQGSLLAYFFNSHGRHAPLAEDVLRRMGAVRMADVVATAIKLRRETADEWDHRHAALDGLPEFSVVRPYEGLSVADALARLTDDFWRAAEADDWGDKLDEYLGAQVLLCAGR